MTHLITLSQFTPSAVIAYIFFEKPVTFLLREGETIPFEVSMKGDFFEFTHPADTLKVKKDIYIQAREDDVYFSSNGVDYKTFTEIATGKLGATFCRTEDTSVSGKLELQAFIRA